MYVAGNNRLTLALDHFHFLILRQILYFCFKLSFPDFIVNSGRSFLLRLLGSSKGKSFSTSKVKLGKEKVSCGFPNFKVVLVESELAQENGVH